MNKIIRKPNIFNLLLCLIFIGSFLTGTINVSAATTVNISGTGSGRIFQGVGAVSAGASTRLLYDYADPYRSDILDFLFKPKFGAGFQHLKVEMGGGENSTCGSEPSHVITRSELTSPKDRGYEFWFMKEARNRNPSIMLDYLPWCFPYWVSGKFTQDSADWFAAFLDVAQNQYSMNVDWVSAAENENGTNRDWIVNILRPTLNAKGYSSTKIQAPDDDTDFWGIFNVFDTDTAYRNTVQAVGYHYINGRNFGAGEAMIEDSGHPTTDKAKSYSQHELWASEDWSCSGETWGGMGAITLARLINKFYIRDRITKTELWCPIDSIYAGLPWESTGAMSADRPWAGHYKVWPSIWAIAHTTQFAQPGWQYLDTGCGQFSTGTWKGTYVTLKDPATNDWSMIICTDTATTMTVNLSGGLKTTAVHVWRSDSSNQFVQQSDITPSGGSFTIAMNGYSIYSLTTTTGQVKGSKTIPSDAPFPFPYQESFESYTGGATPRYYSDQKGTFEVYDSGSGKCLKQVVPQQGYMWVYMQGVLKPYTVFGNQGWTNYSLSADVYIDGGDVELGGRYGDQNNLSYRWILSKTGGWKLNYQSTTLNSGTISGFNGSVWHNMKVVFDGTNIKGYIDGQLLANVTNSSRAAGMAYLASTYNYNCFDNVDVNTTNPNLIPHAQMSATATSQHAGYEASKAIDDNSDSMWHTEWSPMANLPQSITVNLGGTYSINKLYYLPRQDNNHNGVITGYRVYTSTNGSSFTQVASGSWADDFTQKTASFSAVNASHIRLEATAGYGGYAAAAEINIERSSGATPTPMPTATPTPTPGGTNVALNKTATASNEYSSSYSAAKGNDGNTGTRWCAVDGGLNYWWKVDLGGNYDLTGSEVNWEFDGRVYKYKVEVSADNTNWTLKVDKTNNTLATQIQYDGFTASSARYVRITITGLPISPVTWASFWEFKVFGTASAGNTSFVTGVNLGSEIRNDFGDYVGMKFTVGSSGLTVKELGRYFVSGNSGTHTLKIVKVGDGSTVATASINMSSGTADALGYKYVSITPVTLTANTAYYLASLEVNGGDQWYGRLDTGMPQLTTTSAATVNTAVYYMNSVWNEYGTGRCYVPLNFKY